MKNVTGWRDAEIAASDYLSVSLSHHYKQAEMQTHV